MSEPTPERRPDWIWPRADSHIVLSAENSPDVCKTWVEPGGSFSPGVGSYGISVWVWLPDERRLVCPERLPRPAIRDRLLGGCLPVLRSRWRAGDFELDLRLGVEAFAGPHAVCDTLAAKVTNRSTEQRRRATILLTLRSPGPAGGPVRGVRVNPSQLGLDVNGRLAIIGSRQPTFAGCASRCDDQPELSVSLQAGEWPTATAAGDPDGWAGAVLGYEIELGPGATWQAGWDVPVWPDFTEPPGALASRCALDPHERLSALADRWRARLERVTFTAPDARLAEAWNACLTHILMAVDADELRAATICYPLQSQRIGAYLVDALDKAAQHEWADPALARLIASPWAGPLGPEADAPGQLLWAISEHWLLRRDRAWLASVYPTVVERCDALLDMRRRVVPRYEPLGNALSSARLHPDGSLVCRPARDGLIQGRAERRFPVFWVNAWAALGLKRAAAIAHELGDQEHDDTWLREYAELCAALATPAAAFGSDDLDFAGALWPTEARSRDDAATVVDYDRFWRSERLGADNVYHNEPRWRYHELGEAHNLLMLGQVDRMWTVVEQFLRTQDAPGLYAWAEGDDTGDPTGDWARLRGWQPERQRDKRRACPILPHTWVNAELLLLLRDLFCIEEDDGLTIGAGMRSEWLTGGESLALHGAPTRFGQLSWRWSPADDRRGGLLTIERVGGEATTRYRVALPFPAQAVATDESGVTLDAKRGGEYVVATGGEHCRLTVHWA